MNEHHSPTNPGRGTLAPSFVDLHVLVLRFVSVFVAYLGISIDSIRREEKLVCSLVAGEGVFPSGRATVRPGLSALFFAKKGKRRVSF